MIKRPAKVKASPGTRIVKRASREVPRPAAAGNLRLVGGAGRRSVIVDVDDLARGGEMSWPWTVQETNAMRNGPVPHAVRVAGWLAAWARAEGSPLGVVNRALELHCRYEPSRALADAVFRAMPVIVATLGLAVPILVHRDTRRAYGASWLPTWPSERS